jgi:hypothetical protein
MSDATQCNTPTRTPAREAAPLATWRAGFLVALGLTGNVSEACRTVKVERSTAYRARENDPSFAQEWKEAEQQATDALVEQARNLATGQYRSYKFNGKTGEPLLFPTGHELAGQPYYELLYHPGLLQFLLTAHRPEVYGNKLKVEQGPPAGGYDLSKLTPAQLAQLEELSRLATPSALPE